MKEGHNGVPSHTIVALVQNEAGTLNRVLSMFRKRGFSLGSLTAGDCEQEGFSRLTVIVNGDRSMMRQCVTQLEKLVDVVEVDDVPEQFAVKRELALIEVEAKSGQRSEVIEIAHVLGAKVALLTPDTLTLEFSGESFRIDQLVKMLRPYNIKQIARTGALAVRVQE